MKDGKMAMLGVLLCSVALAGPDEQLFNGNFETVDAEGHASDWTYDSEFYSIDKAGGRNGTKAIAFDSRGRDGGSSLQQRVKVMPGVRYHFGVWVRTENLEGKGFCARICLQWEDQYGRFIDGAYYTPHIKGTKSEWVKCDGISAATPENAVWATVRPEVVGPALGKAWFDDVFFGPHATDPVQVLYTSAYRGEQSEGMLTLAAGLNVLGNGVDAKHCQYVFSYKSVDGTEKRIVATSVSSDCAKTDVLVSDMAMGESEVAFSLLSAEGKLLGRKTCSFTRTAQKRTRHVCFDRLGRTIVDGKPFFPLGMYWSMSKPYHKFQLPSIDASNIVEFVKGPFNCTMPYVQPSREQMDICHSNGIKVIYTLLNDFSHGDWDPSGKDTGRRHAQRAVRHIEEFRNHPALLAWYLNDERDVRELENLTGRFRTVSELDPDHPSWIALYQYDQIRDYMPSFDVFGTDPYPIAHSPIEQVRQWASTGLKGAMGIRPMWQVPQAFDWTCFETGKKGDRMPTREEMKNMTWQNIASGANGLIYYSYTYLFQSASTPYEQAWGDVCAVAQEVKDRFDVLLSEGVPPGCAVSNGKVAVRTWRQGKKVYLLVVNTTRDEQFAKVTLDEDFAKVGAVLLGDAPSRVGGRVIDFVLKPISQVIVELLTVEDNIVDFGAKTDGSPAENALAIQKAIDAVASAGGGRVTVPAGEFTSGTIWLGRNVELHLEKGAILKASPHIEDYNADDAFPENFGVPHEYWRGLHFIIAREADNSSITGEGTVHGNGDAFYEEKPKAYYEWMKPGSDAWWNGIRWSKDKKLMRPGQLIMFVKSDHVSVRGITIRNSPCWSLYFWGCDHVRVSDYIVRNGENDGNSDGIDFDCTHDVILERADIDTGDDAIAIRSNVRFGKLDRPEVTDGIMIRDCRVRSTSSVIRLGVGTGVIRNVHMENVTCDRGGSAIMLITRLGEPSKSGCDIENVTMKNCKFVNCARGPVFRGGGDYCAFGIRNVVIEGCSFNKEAEFKNDEGAKFPVSEKCVTFRD